jgi:hypothetical protein
VTRQIDAKPSEFIFLETNARAVDLLPFAIPSPLYPQPPALGGCVAQKVQRVVTTRSRGKLFMQKTDAFEAKKQLFS